MKNRLFIVFILLIAIMATFTTGCKKKIEEKIAEKIIEEATGDEVDISKDTTTVKTEQGETKIGENLKWPKDKMGNLPELKANITMAIEDKEKTLSMIYFDGLKKDDAEKYIESIKELKYESVFETTSGDGFMYSGKDEDGSEVVFSYFNDGTGTLSYTDTPFMFQDNSSDGDSTEDFTGDSSSNEDIDMTDDVPWPKDFFEDIPELEGKITQVSSSSPQDKFVYIEYVTKEVATDYLEKLKEAGFVDSPSESIFGGYLNYEAGHENGDYIVFDWSDSGYATISLVKGE